MLVYSVFFSLCKLFSQLSQFITCGVRFGLPCVSLFAVVQVSNAVLICIRLLSVFSSTKSNVFFSVFYVFQLFSVFDYIVNITKPSEMGKSSTLTLC
jgi:hypothetical protein